MTGATTSAAVVKVVFGISAGFAAPLLQIAGQESGGLHFVGSSRSGKTTILHVAGSIWGGGGGKQLPQAVSELEASCDNRVRPRPVGKHYARRRPYRHGPLSAPAG